ncbi:hypothetical protein DP117_10925 [Brasilonema sp. UFV-L1]|nr:hypothetical protein [Brasilonema sp. UFV-L1]
MNGSFEQATLVSPQPYLELNSQDLTLRLNLKKDIHRLGRGVKNVYPRGLTRIKNSQPCILLICQHPRVLVLRGLRGLAVFEGDNASTSRREGNDVLVSSPQLMVWGS